MVGGAIFVFDLAGPNSCRAEVQGPIEFAESQ